MNKTRSARTCEQLCVPGVCSGCEAERARIELEQAYRRREAWLATRAYARALYVWTKTSVDLAKATATWLWWECWH